VAPLFKFQTMKVVIEFTKDWKDGNKKKGETMKLDGILARTVIDKGFAKKITLKQKASKK
jgi:hypothetical protein